MRIPPLLLIALALLAAGAAAFYFLRPSAAAFGPQVAFCPGPDQYGYTCDAAGSYAYIPGEEDSGLYLDDGTVTLALPFPFRFYGRLYEQVTASSNGNLQFGNANPTFINQCLDEGVAAGMGDLIAAYWDDLDLTFAGIVATTVAGEAPRRIFVVEWQAVPRFSGDLNDTVTFAVQLHEENDDIVILHQDVTTEVGANGRNAVVGIQSESSGRTLAYSCRQAVIADPGGLHIAHPGNPNETATAGTTVAPAALAPKGDVATLLARLPVQGRAALPALNRLWQTAPRPRIAEWRYFGEAGTATLAVLWREAGVAAPAARLAIIDAPLSATPAVLLDVSLADRSNRVVHPEFLTVRELGGAVGEEIIVHNRVDGRHWLATADLDGQWQHQLLPSACGREALLASASTAMLSSACDLNAIFANIGGPAITTE